MQNKILILIIIVAVFFIRPSLISYDQIIAALAFAILDFFTKSYDTIFVVGLSLASGITLIKFSNKRLILKKEEIFQ